jgi:hypothetical protein
MSSVTLLVTPDEAAKLDLGQNMGILTLSLRNPGDKKAALTKPATINQIRFELGLPTDLMAGEPRPPATEPPPPPPQPKVVPARPRPKSIVTLRGSHRGLVSVREGEQQL